MGHDLVKQSFFGLLTLSWFLTERDVSVTSYVAIVEWKFICWDILDWITLSWAWEFLFVRGAQGGFSYEGGSETSYSVKYQDNREAQKNDCFTNTVNVTPIFIIYLFIHSFL
jgi:hypothetical protein